MNEKDPSFTIDLGKNHFELNKGNASVWSFLGRTALDHLFVTNKADENGDRTGSRLWREFFTDEDFSRVATHMANNGFETHMNLPNVPEDDMNAYIRFSTSGEEYIPEDWK